MAVQTQIQLRRGTAASWTSTNPTLAAGEIGLETDTGKFKIGNGSTAWVALAYAAGSTAVTYLFTATAGQTTFSGTDGNGLTLAYTAGAEQVYLNGVLLVRGSDYTASNGTSIVLASGAIVSDILNVIAFGSLSIADAIAKTTLSAKGDILGASAAGTPAVTSVGADGSTLVANSAASTGLSWNAGNWTDWTPTLTNITVGNGTLVARYVKIGKTVHWYFRIIFGSTTSFGAYTAFTLPIAPWSGQFQYNARGLLRDAGTAWYYCSAIVENTDVYPNVELVSGTYSVDRSVSSTVPFTWTTNDAMQLAGTYEVA